MLRWADLAATAPEIAEVGRSLLFHPDQGEVAILATVSRDGRPAVAPVCPIFSAAGVFLSVADETPKAKHLERDGRYALHALVGADDREFQFGGKARRLDDTSEIRAVQADIPFPSYSNDHPVFELLIDRALCVTWPSSAEPRIIVWRLPS